MIDVPERRAIVSLSLGDSGERERVHFAFPVRVQRCAFLSRFTLIWSRGDGSTHENVALHQRKGNHII